MDEITVTGIVSKVMNEYIITTDDGTEFKLSAIMPWEAVSPDFGSGDFALHLGKRMNASGSRDGQTIWGASLSKAQQ
jgi:hypothetical protein